MIEQIILMLLCLAVGVTFAIIFGVKPNRDNKKVCKDFYEEKE